jgi:hypothetical protein
MKADKNEDKIMTTIDFALLIGALVLPAANNVTYSFSGKKKESSVVFDENCSRHTFERPRSRVVDQNNQKQPQCEAFERTLFRGVPCGKRRAK